MRSHLLEGVVRHRRARPFTYGLEHGVWYAALDIDELGGNDKGACSLDDVAREHGLHAELPADVLWIDVLSLETEDGAARHDSESRNL